MTLLEVMMAIGVAFVGLLGVVSLLPLAAHLMNRGATADAVAAFGRSSISDIDVEGALRRDNWAIWNNQNANPNQFVEFVADPSVTNGPADFSNAAQWRGASFCIDPLLISRLYEESLSGTPDAPNLFPRVQMTQPAAEARMARVTLRELPGALLNTVQNPRVMKPIAAEEMFRIKDDLVFNLPGRHPTLPKDSTLPPEQEFSTDTNGRQKRQYTGKLSWMATFSPVVRQNGGGVLQDMYVMSIVVFNGRVLDLNAEPERVVDVAWFWGGGIGGGDLQITPRLNQSDTDLEMKGVSWVMLSGRLPPDQQSNTPGAAVYRWYRVVSADAESQFGPPGDPNYSGPNLHLRDIALHGADWNPGFFVKSQVTIVSGVVAVFEKTVRLEGPTLWATSY